MDGDMVEVSRLKGHGPGRQRRPGTDPSSDSLHLRQQVGAVARVLERSQGSVIGELVELGGIQHVVAIDERMPYDVFIDKRAKSAPAEPGDIVVVRLTAWPSRHTSACGYIEDVVRAKDAQGMRIEVILRSHGITADFPQAALAEAEAMAAHSLMGPPDPDATVRRDLTGVMTFTIDPPDARDFDDALSLEHVDGETLLGVHIADVSSFVRLRSALDMAAQDRALSVYLPDRVVGMLPTQLSDDLCSLKPGLRRRCLSVLMRLDKDGNVSGTEFVASTIASSARLTYDEADACLRGDAEGPSLPAGIRQRLLALGRLTQRLRRRRLARGAIDFDASEPKVIVDGDGRPCEIVLRRSTPATELVEEAMILANEQVAGYLMSNMRQAVYRTHADPLPAALEDAEQMLAASGHRHGGPPLVGSASIQAVLAATAGRPEQIVVSSILLRAMRRAQYSSQFTGHFGLASPAYCHFTSPIRRYPDLLTHHLLRLSLAGLPLPEGLAAELEPICDHSSRREQAAEAASREATQLMMAEYMASRVGQEFKALVVGVGSLGLFVREQTTAAEGLVSRESLGTGFIFDPAQYRYIDPSRDLALSLGVELTVRLVEADLSGPRLDFVIVWLPDEKHFRKGLKHEES
jgi:ribonuclease R